MHLGRCLRPDGRYRPVSWWRMQALFGCLVAPVQLLLSDICTWLRCLSALIMSDPVVVLRTYLFVTDNR